MSTRRVNAKSNIAQEGFLINGSSILELSKKCVCCGKYKPLSMFYKDRSHNDGHSSWCKECQREGKRKKSANKRGEWQIQSSIPRPLQEYDDDIIINELRFRGFRGELRVMKETSIEI